MDKSHPYNACVCLAVRRLSRVLSQLYDAKLAPAGVTHSQFTLLSALSGRAEGIPLSPLAGALDLDLSTLSRNLKPLIKDGSIVVIPGEDRRQRRAVLTKKGQQRVAQANRQWKRIQQDVLKSLGPDTHGTLLALLQKAHALQ